MATSTTSLLPNQEQPQVQQEVPIYTQSIPNNNNNNNNNAWHNNTNKGSIGPFFGVISVLAVLAIISCLVGRFWIGKENTPLESIKHRGSCCGWLKRRRFGRSAVDAGGVRGGKVAAVAPPLPDERGFNGS
ncbi:uncharacterized protein LOC130798433 [Amaranthus tricolor]|uniref:uncharacterized protein LOC130798433 n=1 Tax=Amaranthus tricolor TaxID=29722 RepID=UPI00258FBC2E|nr:uncharacterized protein LOC130798433 [Amaranthus tricolor]